MKILWVKAGGLVPPDIGGKIRSYHILRELSYRHDITFFTFYAEHPRDEHDQLKRMFTSVIYHPLRIPRSRSLGDIIRYAGNLFSRDPYLLIKYCKPEVRESLINLLQSQRFDVIVCDFLFAAGVIPWDFPCPKVIFTHNVEAFIWKRHLELARNPVWKAVCRREYSTMREAECRYLGLADHVLTVSDIDRDIFLGLNRSLKITVIPTGVELDFFRPTGGESHPNSMVFTGAMDWMANEDGVFYFVQDVFPLIRIEIPDASLLIVGRNPSPRLVELCRVTEGIEVTGRVEDIRPYVQRASVYVVPLRVGSGTRLKIFEAMAMGKAIVSTSIGAEGLPVQSGRNIMIADKPETFAATVVELLRNDVRREELARAARDLVVEKYSWGEVAKHFEAALEKLVGTGIDIHANLQV